ncbi:MAG: DUF126 domain-containing protein [Proteobacteria bacterium]|nr:DUF126 domain-containing protein [Pseudomonadota bacterium]
MEKIILRGRGILPGVAQAQALVSDEQIVWSHGVEPWRGVIDDRKVKLHGQSIKGKVSVYPYGKGSTSSSTWILETIRCGNAPAAIINRGDRADHHHGVFIRPASLRCFDTSRGPVGPGPSGGDRHRGLGASGRRGGHRGDF